MGFRLNEVVKVSLELGKRDAEEKLKKLTGLKWDLIKYIKEREESGDREFIKGMIDICDGVFLRIELDKQGENIEIKGYMKVRDEEYSFVPVGQDNKFFAWGDGGHVKLREKRRGIVVMEEEIKKLSIYKRLTEIGFELIGFSWIWTKEAVDIVLTFDVMGATLILTVRNDEVVDVVFTTAE